uniref:Uncharacterized protein n=1 Tax=Hanusia phi TaxID=3032 RepID=A0A7S0I4R7_9CRYP
MLNFAANYLCVGGRLVYWLPTTTSYNVDDLPQHPCMSLMYNCEDILSTKLSRRLITMKKNRNPQADEKATCKITEAGLEPAHQHFADKYWGEGKEQEDGESKKRKRNKRKTPNTAKEESDGEAENQS